MRRRSRRIVLTLTAAATIFAGATMLRLRGEGLDGGYRFSIDATAEGHKRIRTALRRKYGWRDRWIDALAPLHRRSTRWKRSLS